MSFAPAVPSFPTSAALAIFLAGVCSWLLVAALIPQLRRRLLQRHAHARRGAVERADRQAAPGVQQLDSADAHRWRFGLTRTPLGAPTLIDQETGVAVAGDWCLGPTIEDALQSGTAAAHEIDGLLST